MQLSDLYNVISIVGKLMIGKLNLEVRVKVSKETVVLRRWRQQGNFVISTKLKM